MFLEEHLGKHFLAQAGIAIPRGQLVDHPDAAATAARQVGGPVLVKSQVPAGKRGKAGGIRHAADSAEAGRLAQELLASEVAGYRVQRVLVEERISIAHEWYIAIINDVSRRSPLLLFSTAGGVDIEDVHATSPERILKLPVDIRNGIDQRAISALIRSTIGEGHQKALVDIVAKLFALYRLLDAELIEINPLAVAADGRVVALDCKLVIDDSAIRRHPELPVPEPRGTALELKAKTEGLLYVELDGAVGVLANGAGLTMATMDAIHFYGGRPANFMEIGGEAYKKSAVALSIVLGNPRVKSLLVNLCGAYARTDVMVEGILDAWDALGPAVPVAFSVHGTGEARAIELLHERMHVAPHPTMDDAVRAAIEMGRA